MKTTRSDRISIRPPAALAAVVLVLGTIACGGDGAEEAHDPTDHTHDVGSVVVTQWNDSTELFLEYPHPLAGQATGNWAIHLTELDGYGPVTEGRLALRFLRNGNEAERFTADAPARDGIFLIDPGVEEPGTYRVELVLESTQVTSTHVLEQVEVYADSHDAPAPATGDGGGGIAFLKEQQWPLDFAIAEARRGELPRRVEVSGEIVPRDGGLAEVTAPLDAVARARENASAPPVGARVDAGDRLAVLSPSVGSGGYADLKGRVRRLEREVDRAERLLDAGAIPERRLVEARHDLEVARAELEAVGGDPEGGYLLTLRAPMDGVVAARDFVPGGRVAAGSHLYRIVDPSTLWLRARIPARASAEVATEPLPTFTVEGGDTAFTADRVVSMGSVLDPRTRTLPALFAVDNEERRLKVGQTARVHVSLGGSVQGVVVPASAVLDEDGVSTVYVEVGGETFERRVVDVGASDGRRAVLTRGVRPGEMVVSTGAYQVRLASLSGESFGAGHTH